MYRSKDERWVVIAANHDTLWRRLAALMGKPGLADDPRFETHHARGQNEDLLDEIVSEWASRYTAEELDRMVNEAGVVCAPVYTAEDICKDQYFRERGLLVEHRDEVHGDMMIPGVVPRLEGTPGTIRQPARWAVGADTEAVLGELGVGADELRALADQGVIAPPSGAADGSLA